LLNLAAIQCFSGTPGHVLGRKPFESYFCIYGKIGKTQIWLLKQHSAKFAVIERFRALHPQRGIYSVHSTGSQKTAYFVHKSEDCSAFGYPPESSGIRA
jgi:hypothetical protein